MMAFCSWGFLVHKTAHQLAVYQLPSTLCRFFYRNMDYMQYNAVRPDVRRNTDSTEDTKHFIDLEIYGDSAAWRMPLYWKDAVKQYSKDTLLTYGYAPYHIIYMQQKLTDAFRQKNADSILFYAADLGHYIEDIYVPLHLSVNYDGQLTNQKGLHSLWETMVPEIEISNYNLRSRHKAAYIKNKEAAVWGIIRKTERLLPDVFAKEKEVSARFTDAAKYRMQKSRKGEEYRSYTTEFAKAYAAALKHIINQQLIYSANSVADFWYTAWVDAGKPGLDALIKTEFTPAEKDKLKAELKAYRRNELIEKNMLRAKEKKPAE